MGDPKVEIDILFVGQTGVGKSSLINLVRRVREKAPTAAETSNDARPCTSQTVPYPLQLGDMLHCQLWDTRGLDEAVENHDRRFMAKILDRIRQLAHQQERELREAIRKRARAARPMILMWCIHAAKIDVPVHWQQFRKVFVDYCGGNAIPVVVITRMDPKKAGRWEERCRDQLQSLDLGPGTGNTEVRLLRVREHRDLSPEYTEDSDALRGLISEVVSRKFVDG